MANQEDAIKTEVEETLSLQKTLEDTEQQLMQNEEFRKFLTMQKEFKEKIDQTWKNVEQQMIDNNIKSIKGDWGSITIAERNNFKVDLDVLPKKYIKKVADTTKIGQAFKLEGVAPKGVEVSTIKYITKRIK